jgi:hypothetical protein
VCVWAEQYGAAHEDWTIDEAFSVTLQWDGVMKNQLVQIAGSAPLEIADVFASLAHGPGPTARSLLGTARTVHRIGNQFLDTLTPDRMQQAEAEWEWRRRGGPRNVEPAETPAPDPFELVSGTGKTFALAAAREA